MTRQLEDKRAVVTGGASGIGKATACLFASEGARVVVADLDDRNGNAVAEEIVRTGGNAKFVRTDVRDPESVAALYAAAEEYLGAIDTVVNIAGVLRAGSAIEMSDEDWNLVLDVNLYACLLSARYAVPHLRAAGGGTITNVGSVAGIIGVPGAAAYAAAKAAVVLFSKSLAKELVADKIRVNAVCPGWVDTTFNDPIVAVMGGRAVQDRAVANDVPMRRQGNPEEIAPAFAFLASDGASYLTGKTIVVDGGAT
jgi:NAD(P)-dependent dehydrogenase (short-subunit alcohol dehydrogenase family)